MNVNERDKTRNAIALAILAAVVLFALTACAPMGRASSYARDGAPYYRGMPGGTPVEVAPPVDYRLPGGAR